MASSIPNQPNFPVETIVKMGICRKTDCLRYGTFGPRGVLCPGNHSYPTRASTHFFEHIETEDEEGRANDANHGNTIGVCKTEKWFSIGFKN